LTKQENNAFEEELKPMQRKLLRQHDQWYVSQKGKEDLEFLACRPKTKVYFSSIFINSSTGMISIG